MEPLSGFANWLKRRAAPNWLKQTVARRRFDNRQFWNDRYLTNPAKGSGPGSRGDYLLLKRDIIRSAIEEYGVKTMLDVGCGDIAVLSSIHVGRYVGIDISNIVVEHNRAKRPDWEFLCEDLTGPFRPEPADLVLCLDVLIHQKSFENYLAILSKMLAATKKVALISGYSKSNTGWNTFFHEPLGDSIARLCPDGLTTRVAEYRGTDLFKVEMRGKD